MFAGVHFAASLTPPMQNRRSEVSPLVCVGAHRLAAELCRTAENPGVNVGECAVNGFLLRDVLMMQSLDQFMIGPLSLKVRVVAVAQ